MNSEVQSQPQADGADRPFHTRGHTGPVRVHVEKSGPAFSAPFLICNQDVQFAATGQPSVEDMLVQSLIAQAVGTVGELLNALGSRPGSRRCFLDVCAVWPRLLRQLGVQSQGAYASLRPNWEWQEMREAVELALVYADNPKSLKWQKADAMLRTYARDAALAIESRLDPADPNLTMLTINAGKYRAFAEGRS